MPPNESEFYQPFQPVLTASGLKRFGLGLEMASPGARLRGVVHSYLQIKATAATPYPIIPDASQALFISAQSTTLGGAQCYARDIPILQAGDYFGVRFYPGMLRRFIDLNLADITDKLVDLHQYARPKSGSLHDHIFQQQTFTERVTCCEQWLMQQVNAPASLQFEQALDLIYQSMGKVRVSFLATKTGWSSRHLNRVFRRHTGLGTKAFSQTIRFQSACRQLYETPYKPLSSLPGLGFFDQSHLIKDLKQRLLQRPDLFFKRFRSDFYNI